MSKELIFNVLLLFSSISLYGVQKQEELPAKLAVEEVINSLFLGMKEGDSARVHRAFRDDVTLYTSFTNKKGQAVLKQGSLQDFLIGVGTPHEEPWNEQIKTMEIQIDDNLAHVWTKYSFYLGTNFVHCGVNSFQLIHSDSEWKIINLIDTRKIKECKDGS